MIDNDLIARSIEHARYSLDHQQAVIPGILGKTKAILHPDLVEKINSFLKSDKCVWLSETGQENLARGKINWLAESVIEELHEIMMALTPEINKMFPAEADKHFWGISLWKDTGGYYIHEHTDNTDLHSVIHVYLDSQGMCPGTVFHHSDSLIDIAHEPNSGYVYCNGQQKLTHNISYAVPQGTTRYSLYAQWSLVPKYFSNTP